MRMLKRLVFLLALCGPFIFTSCETSRVTSGGPYHVTAYKPNDPSKVVVKVSLSKQNVYVMEGDRCLMAVACSVGIPSKPKPDVTMSVCPSGCVCQLLRAQGSNVTYA